MFPFLGGITVTKRGENQSSTDCPFYSVCCNISLIPRPHPAFHRLQATESWAGSGNEAIITLHKNCSDTELWKCLKSLDAFSCEWIGSGHVTIYMWCKP